MYTNDIERLLQKYYSGSISKEEFTALKEKVNLSTDEEMRIFLQRHWTSFDDNTPLAEKKKEVLYRNLQRRMRVPMRVRMRTFGMRIAAGILLLISIGLSVLFYTQEQEIRRLTSRNVVIRSGEAPSSIVLPDGTNVQLNTRSSLTYQQNFGHEERCVQLSGEGYFEVKRDEARPFVVQTGFIDITVLGTSFNVYAYEDKDFLEMALVEGSVRVNTIRPPYKTLHAKPHEKITYDKHTGELTLEATSNHAETAWKESVLQFQHTPMSEVIRTLERRFNIVIRTSGLMASDDAYTGTFQKATLENILDVLKQHYGFTYIRENDTIRIDMK